MPKRSTSHWVTPPAVSAYLSPITGFLPHRGWRIYGRLLPLWRPQHRTHLYEAHSGIRLWPAGTKLEHKLCRSRLCVKENGDRAYSILRRRQPHPFKFGGPGLDGRGRSLPLGKRDVCRASGFAVCRPQHWELQKKSEFTNSFFAAHSLHKATFEPTHGRVHTS